MQSREEEYDVNKLKSAAQMMFLGTCNRLLSDRLLSSGRFYHSISKKRQVGTKVLTGMASIPVLGVAAAPAAGGIEVGAQIRNETQVKRVKQLSLKLHDDYPELARIFTNEFISVFHRQIMLISDQKGVDKFAEEAAKAACRCIELGLVKFEPEDNVDSIAKKMVHQLLTTDDTSVIRDLASTTIKFGPNNDNTSIYDILRMPGAVLLPANQEADAIMYRSKEASPTSWMLYGTRVMTDLEKNSVNFKNEWALATPYRAGTNLNAARKSQAENAMEREIRNTCNNPFPSAECLIEPFDQQYRQEIDRIENIFQSKLNTLQEQIEKIEKVGKIASRQQLLNNFDNAFSAFTREIDDAVNRMYKSHRTFEPRLEDLERNVLQMRDEVKEELAKTKDEIRVLKEENAAIKQELAESRNARQAQAAQLDEFSKLLQAMSKQLTDLKTEQNRAEKSTEKKHGDMLFGSGRRRGSVS